MTLLKIPNAYTNFVAPADMSVAKWYPHSYISKPTNTLLTQVLASSVDSYMLELGSFIGNSAIGWVKALRAVGKESAVVCIDTWLGDLAMLHWRGKFLETGKTGTPRLYEQFMINTRAQNVSSQIVPMRQSAVVALRYLRDLVVSGRLPRPNLIYLDAAHLYPETEFEADAAWEVLAPGGYLVGDDFDQFWPEVQQSVNEFVLRKGASEFVDPAVFTAGWPSELRNEVTRATLLDARAVGVDLGRVSPLLKGNQWVLKKVDAQAESSRTSSWRRARNGDLVSQRPRLRTSLRCCLNGWEGYVNRTNRGQLQTCVPPMPFFQQGVCRGLENRWLHDGEVHCRFKYICY